MGRRPLHVCALGWGARAGRYRALSASDLKIDSKTSVGHVRLSFQHACECLARGGRFI